MCGASAIRVDRGLGTSRRVARRPISLALDHPAAKGETTLLSCNSTTRAHAASPASPASPPIPWGGRSPRKGGVGCCQRAAHRTGGESHCRPSPGLVVRQGNQRRRWYLRRGARAPQRALCARGTGGLIPTGGALVLCVCVYCMEYCTGYVHTCSADAAARASVSDGDSSDGGKLGGEERRRAETNTPRSERGADLRSAGPGAAAYVQRYGIPSGGTVVGFPAYGERRREGCCKSCGLHGAIRVRARRTCRGPLHLPLWQEEKLACRLPIGRGCGAPGSCPGAVAPVIGPRSGILPGQPAGFAGGDRVRFARRRPGRG